MNKKIFICPANTPADALILPNDTFEEYKSKYPDLPKHLVKFNL